MAVVVDIEEATDETAVHASAVADELRQVHGRLFHQVVFRVRYRTLGVLLIVGRVDERQRCTAPVGPWRLPG